MQGLLDEATVLNGDGNWTSGYSIEALSCGRTMLASDICTPPALGTPSDFAGTFRVDPFAIMGYQRFGVLCEPETAESELQTAIGNATEYYVAKNFWSGDIPNWPGAVSPTGSGKGLYLMHADVTTVTAGASTSISIAKALKKAYDDNPDIQPIIHMGLNVAFGLPATKADDLGFSFVISPGYPTDGIAVTGPIVVRLGSLEGLDSHDWTQNRHYFDGTRLAAVEFDPCYAVRVA